MSISLAFAPENVVYARQVQPSRPASACSFSTPQAESGPYSQAPFLVSRFPRRSKPSITIGSVPSLSGHALAHTDGVRRPRLRRHRASGRSSRQGSSSNGWCVYSGNPVHASMKMRPSALSCAVERLVDTPGWLTDRLNVRNELLHRFFPFIK